MREKNSNETASKVFEGLNDILDDVLASEGLQPRIYVVIRSRGPYKCLEKSENQELGPS